MTRIPVGAFTSLPSQNAAGASAYAQAFPGARTFRWFHTGMPASIASTEAAGCAAAGLVPYLSCKPGPNDLATVAKLAGTVPANAYGTFHHEPEAPAKGWTGPAFAARFRACYTAAKSVAPSWQLGYTSMAYQWDKADRSDFDPGVGDFYACDIYSESWRSADKVTPLPLDQLPGFMRWHRWASTTGKPLVAAELGCSTLFSDAARAAWYQHAIEWLTGQGYTLILPWNGNGTPGAEQFYYWGGPAPFPLTCDVIRKATAPAPTPAPANPTPWAYPISPDPTARIRTLQTALGLSADGMFGDGTLTAVEQAVTDLQAARTSIANALHELGSAS